MIIEIPPSEIDVNDLDLLERVITSSVKTFRDRITYLEGELDSYSCALRRLRDFTMSLAHDSNMYATTEDLADAARDALGHNP